jgi:hypothetical protein
MHAPDTELTRLAAALTPLAALPSRPFTACAQLTLPAWQPPWQTTGIHVRKGQSYSVFARGVVQWAPGLPELHGGPRFHLWARVAPGGSIRNLREDTDTFVADVDGDIELGLYMGVWRDALGTLATGPAPYARLEGGLDAVVIAWRDAPSAGLAALDVALRSPLLAAEAAHLARQPPAVAGWRHLLETGETHLFTPGRTPDGGPSIRIDGHDDQGILCRELEFPLTPETRLSWAWRLEAHPSRVREDSVRAHDYISIATEFDNGRDLTWFWSTSLPPGHHFACPVKAWSHRETHLVVRSGSAGLGQWQREERAVRADVERSMGPPPGRIVRVWLIAVASFQHGSLRAEFSDIRLSNGPQSAQVL